MTIRGRVFRIDLAVQPTEWVGEPWAWEVIDRDKPAKRIDGHPDLIDWGYAPTHEEAIDTAHRTVGLLRIVDTQPHPASGHPSRGGSTMKLGEFNIVSMTEAKNEEGVQQHHQDESAPWVCPTCGVTFPADQVERHQERHEWI